MKKISRRDFLRQCVIGGAALATPAMLFPGSNALFASTQKLGQVVLGKSGVKVSRLAWGTGTNGWKHRSDQTSLGEKGFLELALHAYAAGITFFDTADIYGSHQKMQRVLKEIPREKVVIMSKIWTSSNNWLEFKGVLPALDRFRKEIGTDYLDLVLLHCQVSPNWLIELQRECDDLANAKEKGIIRTFGVSCHSFDALKAAAASDWVQVLLARINHTGSHMDETPEKVMTVLKQAHDSGKGVIGMKIFGCGDLVAEKQRHQSLTYVWHSKNVDAMTIGFEKKSQVDDTITSVNHILSGTL